MGRTTKLRESIKEIISSALENITLQEDETDVQNGNSAQEENTEQTENTSQSGTGTQEEDPGLQIDVYYGQAKNDHSKQYVIFSVEEVTRQDGRITYELEVNCIDYGFDTELCEEMADSITAALDHSVTIKEEIEFHVYANRRNNVSAQDEKIIRRRLTFDLYLYERT